MAVAVDSAGNVLVAGQSSGTSGNYDCVTIKYSPTGVRQWIADFNGAGNSYDGPLAIAADRFGNVYVAGYTMNASSDFLTIKYDSEGHLLWQAQYDGPGHGQDSPYAMAVDMNGNVYVTGYSVGTTSQDFATIKYSAAGVEEWVARYTSAESSVSYPYAIALDGSGGVYVAGFTGGRAATIKYNSSGLTQWVAGRDSMVAFALALDAAGNVYVAGEAAGAVSDFMTVKYTPSGVQAWERRYDGPGHNTDAAHDIALDDQGNIYVTGPSVGDSFRFNSATIKYSPSGVEQWVRRYAGSGWAGDYTFLLGVDGAGDVTVAGYSDGWATGYDFTTIRYNTSGTEEWVARYNGPANETDYLNAAAMDNAGNFYVTGNSAGIGTSNDYATVKYSAAGAEEWSARYDGVEARLTNHWITVTQGPNGSAYPSGYIYAPEGADQTVVIRPDPDHHIDSVIVDGADAGTDSVYSFTSISSDHTLRVAFKLNSNAIQYRTFTYDSLIVKSPAKKRFVTQYWEFTITNSTTAAINVLNIRFDRDVLSILGCGGLSAEGGGRDWRFSGTLQRDETVVIRGRSPKPRAQAITELWFGPSVGQPRTGILPTRQYSELPLPNAANLREDAYARGVFASTNGLVLGIPDNSPRPTHGWVRMSSPKRLLRSLSDRGQQHDNIVTGFSSFANHRPILGEQQSLSPVQQNNRMFADLMALKFSIALSAAGISHVGLGELRFLEAGSPYDGMLVRDIARHADSLLTFYVPELAVYEQADSILEKINLAFSGQIDTVTWAAALQLRGVKRLLEVPYLQESDVPPATIPLLNSAEAMDMPLAMELRQNYPNPFNPATTISIRLSSPSLVSLRVYNMVGQEVASLTSDQVLDEGEHEFAWDASRFASGVYFCRMSAQAVRDDGGAAAEPLVTTRKMILLK
jgi:uncharacterized delta-60 repeat protein